MKTRSPTGGEGPLQEKDNLMPFTKDIFQNGLQKKGKELSGWKFGKRSWKTPRIHMGKLVIPEVKF